LLSDEDDLSDLIVANTTPTDIPTPMKSKITIINVATTARELQITCSLKI